MAVWTPRGYRRRIDVARISGDGPDGRFRHASRAPDPRLAGLVRGYGDFEERTPAPLARDELASADVVVIVDLGPGWSVEETPARPGRPPVRFGSFVGGLHDGPTRVGHAGEARCVQVDLTPPGARALLGVPVGELAHRVVALEDLLGPAAAGRLAERLHGARDAEARFALLDRVLLARAAAAQGTLRPDALWAWRRLEETQGRVRVDALARELGCSRRHLSGVFGRELGLPPKPYARVLRLRRATALISAHAGAATDLPGVAVASGYSDQAHFTREFRALAGTTPAAWAAAQLFPSVQDADAAAA